MHEFEPEESTPRLKSASTASNASASSSTASTTGKTSVSDSWKPYFLEHTLMAEYRLLYDQGLPGLHVIPSANSPLVWFGVLFIRSGLYEGGVFKFTMFIPEKYPDADCPRIVFDVPVFHPLVDPVSGELDCRRAFQKWRRNVNYLWQLILYARRVFYKIDTKPQPLNPEAAVLVEENMEVFKFKVEETIETCREKLFDKPKIEDDHAIRFCQLEDSLFQQQKESILTIQLPSPDPSNAYRKPSRKGLSWMVPGSTDIFARIDPALRSLGSSTTSDSDSSSRIEDSDSGRMMNSIPVQQDSAEKLSKLKNLSADVTVHEMELDVKRLDLRNDTRNSSQTE